MVMVSALTGKGLDRRLHTAILKAYAVWNTSGLHGAVEPLAEGSVQTADHPPPAPGAAGGSGSAT